MAIADRAHINDIHATILKLMGLDTSSSPSCTTAATSG